MAYSAGGRKLSAVDAILAEAADLVALEQIARLNTAHLDLSSDALPSSLESRFRKLKSLPAAAPPPAAAKALARSATAPRTTPAPLDPPPQPSPPPQQQPIAPAPVREEDEEDAAGEKENSNSTSSPPQQAPPPAVHVPAAAHQDDGDEDLEQLFGPAGGRGRPTLRERNRGRDDDTTPSPPPARQACCFGFSPKKQRTPPTKSKGRKKVHGSSGAGDGGGDALGIDAGEWGDENRRIVEDLREQQRKLKKALEEQVKVSRETAKMARWVKQASARMTHTAAIDDLLSDCDDDDDLK